MVIWIKPKRCCHHWYFNPALKSVWQIQTEACIWFFNILAEASSFQIFFSDYSYLLPDIRVLGLFVLKKKWRTWIWDFTCFHWFSLNLWLNSCCYQQKLSLGSLQLFFMKSVLCFLAKVWSWVMLRSLNWQNFNKISIASPKLCKQT